MQRHQGTTSFFCKRPVTQRRMASSVAADPDPARLLLQLLLERLLPVEFLRWHLSFIDRRFLPVSHGAVPQHAVLLLTQHAAKPQDVANRQLLLLLLPILETHSLPREKLHRRLPDNV